MTHGKSPSPNAKNESPTAMFPTDDSSVATGLTGPTGNITSPTRNDNLSEADPSRTTAHDRNNDDPTQSDVEAKIRALVEQNQASQRARVKHDPFIGTDIQGRFRVESKIGEGGMGAVYRAVQTSVGRPVAIKILLRALVKDEQFVRRFQNEALAVSRLEHPNTIRIFDFGQVDDATLFFAMELLNGLPLQKVLKKEQRLSVARMLHVLEQAARSLGEAHSKGIIHRDLKPDNLFLCEVDGDKDFVKVLDFGVAKMVGEDKAQDGLTQTHMILGTPKYMSPEQASGKPVDGRSDLYALGVMAYEMLAGRAPFTGDPMTVLYHQVHDDPPPLSEISPEIVVPPDVQDLVFWLLKKRPEERPQSSDQLVATIGRCKRSLDPAFSSVVLRSDPTRQELIARMDTSTYEPITGIAEAVPMTAAPNTRRMPKWAIPSAIAAIVAGGALAVYLGKPNPSDESAKTEISARMVAPSSVSSPTAEIVRLQVMSEPPNALVFRGATELGKTPVIIERKKSGATETLRVQFSDGKQQLLDVEYNSDGTYVAKAPVAAGGTPEIAPVGHVPTPTSTATPVAAETNAVTTPATTNGGGIGNSTPKTTKSGRPKDRPQVTTKTNDPPKDVPKPPDDRVNPLK
ncbi:MAG: serine/threonine protein kinase [Myxococcales bacterium]|nr:serine/threonine protein kinase [Myxococcales bacterium]